MLGLRFLVVAPLLAITTWSSNPPESPTLPTRALALNISELIPLVPKPDYDQQVLAPLHADQAREALQAAQAVAQALATQQAAQKLATATAAQVALQVKLPVIASTDVTSGTLDGAIGYSLPYGNCVDQAGVNNPGYGNPIDWPILTRVATIGATVLFYFNHTAVVSGIWSNGDIEVYQQNAPGMSHRIPASEIRGFR